MTGHRTLAAGLRVSCAVLTALLISLPLASHAADKDRAQIQQLIKQHGFSSRGMGVYIRDAQAPTPLVSLNDDRAYNPASVIKLLTTAVAIDQMGAGYRWLNEWLYDGQLSSGTLRGNLYFRGNGDPYLTPERFWLSLNKLYMEGVRRIEGNVYFDDSYFQPESIDYAAFDNQPYRTYHVGPNAVLIGFQATELHFAIEDGKLNIVPFPTAKTIEIDNQVEIRNNGACGRWEKRLQLTPRINHGIVQVKITGKYAAACGSRTMYRRISETDQHFELFFRPLWQQIGGSLSGSISRQQVPQNAIALIQDESISLSAVIRFINKFSNNVMTRQVLLSLGAYKMDAPGTTAKGIQVIQQWLNDRIKAKQISDKKALVLDNGAGLSRDTRISAKLLGELLFYIYQQPYMPDFISSLPISGYDATMAHRLNGAELIGKAYMKTGLLDFVQTTAGFISVPNGKRYIVVILHNDKRAHTRKATILQNDILRWVYEHG